MKYYYLAAALPVLSFGEPPGIPMPEFMNICADHLSVGDMSALTALMDSESVECDHPFVREWNLREAALRNTIAATRAARLQRDAAPYLRDEVSYECLPETVVAEAFTKTSPLARERMIDSYRWNQIEELAGLDPFSSRAMLAYGLKFQLCDRWRTIDRERGEEKADAIVNQPEQEPHTDTENT